MTARIPTERKLFHSKYGGRKPWDLEVLGALWRTRLPTDGTIKTLGIWGKGEKSMAGQGSPRLISLRDGLDKNKFHNCLNYAHIRRGRDRLLKYAGNQYYLTQYLHQGEGFLAGGRVQVPPSLNPPVSCLDLSALAWALQSFGYWYFRTLSCHFVAVLCIQVHKRF